MTNFEFLMRKKDLSCKDVAKNPRVKVSVQTVQNWRTKRSDMPESAKVIVSEILECKTEKLLEDVK